MDQMAVTYSRTATCNTLNISRSTSYAQKQKPLRARIKQDQDLTMKITDSFVSSRKTYGSPRIQQDLLALGLHIGKNRINRLMRQAGLRPKQKRRFRPQTTQTNPSHPVADNDWARFPSPDQINQVWVSDITYILTQEGWLYLAGLMDACSRKIVGWHTKDNMETPLVTEAWNQAQQTRRPDPGLLHHSDRGSQYTSCEFRSLLKSSGVAASMSRRGNCYDNAHQESFWATLKAECFGDYVPKTRNEARRMIFDYIHCFYNPRRRHSSLNYLSPDQFETILAQKLKNN